MWQGAGVEGARCPPRPPSETTSLALASRSAVAVFFARMDVRRAAAAMVGAAMLSRWRLREQMLDDATRGGGAGDAKRRRRYGGRRRWMGSYPAAGATAMDAAMPLSPPTDNGDG